MNFMANIPGAFAAEAEPANNHEHPRDTEPETQAPPDPYPGWTYPTRMCRICREDVIPTVTMYPPGVPMKYQRPVVEYKNDDEYGRLIRPCKCRGGMRYIHEYCLARSRAEGVRPDSLWKCHECGHQFNFQRLTLQRYLRSKMASGILTILFMLCIMFFLGFVADPIINLYVDPYDTIVGNEPYWSEVDVATNSGRLEGWGLHFLKGLISMGLVGFLKTALLNPFNFFNLRGTGFVSSRRSTNTGTTGRERAVNVSWIAVAIGIMSAFYFFYKWVQTIIGHTLTRLGNNIVDTHYPDDDDDLKPPPTWQAKPTGSREAEKAWQAAERMHDNGFSSKAGNAEPHVDANPGTSTPTKEVDSHSIEEDETVVDNAEAESSQTPTNEAQVPTDSGVSSALEDAREQGWSFVGIPRQR
jgi:hypothetical protein